MRRTLIALLGSCLLTSCAARTTDNLNYGCNKACLNDVTENFLEAKVRGDLSSLELADNIRMTSNSQITPAGTGPTWNDGISFVNRYTFVDESTQTSIFFGTIAGMPREDDQTREWWHYAVRITLDNEGRVLEIEEQANTKGFKHPSKLEVPFKEAAIFNAVLPEDERVPESEMIAAADSYWDALTTGDGNDVPFGPNCQRTEFGSYSTNNPLTHDRTGNPDFVPQQQIGRSCRKFFDGPRFRWPTDNRRYYVVDEARGVVVGIGQLNKFGENGIPGLTLIEAFKIVNGRIEFLWAPAFAWGIEDSGWDDWERPQ